MLYLTQIDQARVTPAFIDFASSALDTPTGNAQGGYYFLSLTTGRRLSRQQWDELPMPDGVIATVEAMAAAQSQAIRENEGLVFEWSPGITIEDENEAQIILDEPFEDEQIVDAHDEDIIFEENNMMEADNVDIGDQEENIMMEVGDDDVEDVVENTEVEEDLLCWSPRSYWIGDG
jgi:hypothetical protein